MRNRGIEYATRGQMRFCDLGEPPALKPAEILLRTRYSGITNGTERHALLAEHFWSAFPSRHGYQHVAEVEAVGEEVTEFQPGDRVFYGDYVGHRAWNVVDVGPGVAHRRLHLPEEIDPKEFALFGVAGVAMRNVRRCRVAPAQNVWVVGQGLIGQYSAQAARATGAMVTVTDVIPRRLEVARELGAQAVLDASDPATRQAVKDRGPFDHIIDCAGMASLMPQIYEDNLLAPGGILSLMAVRSEVAFDWRMLHTKECSIAVSCHFDRDDLRVLLHFVRQGIIRTAPLISHVVPIDQAPVIYEILRDRPAELLGVIFDWNV